MIHDDEAFTAAPAESGSDERFVDERFDPYAASEAAWPEVAPEATIAPADPWGPGSWGEVSSFGDDDGGRDRDQAFDPAFEPAFEQAFDPAFDPAFASNGGAVSGNQAFNEFPREGLPVIGGDRYTRDLDQAVNQPDESRDDAMTAFFEGDDDPQTRRFGRRR